MFCHPSIVPLSSSSLWRKSSGDSPEDLASNLPGLEGELEAWEGDGNLTLGSLRMFLPDLNTHFLCVLWLVVYSGISGKRRAYQDGGEDGGLYDPPQ